MGLGQFALGSRIPLLLHLHDLEFLGINESLQIIGLLAVAFSLCTTLGQHDHFNSLDIIVTTASF